MHFLALRGDSIKVSFTFRYRLYDRERVTTIAVAIVERAINKERAKKPFPKKAEILRATTTASEKR